LIYCFGAFTLDSLMRRLTRDGTDVPLRDRHVDVLLCLLAHPNDVVAKDSLVQAAWGDVAVTDNSLEQAISMLRRVPISIETVPRRGYRFVGHVDRKASKHSDAELDALLTPHRAWLEGRAALETLSVQKVDGAEKAFRRVLESSPDHASAHVGLANALAFRFEASRLDEQADLAAIAAAMPHAREACRLQPEWAEAWATLGFILHRTGDYDHGQAALRRSVELEPDNWRHHLRVAFVCWGEARLRAAQRTLQLMPGLALAEWLAASVHVARQAFDAAERHLAAGAAAQDQQTEGAMFGGIGLHWASGLLRLSEGDADAAERHFDRELQFEDSGHLYARECCTAAWYAKACHAYHRGDCTGANAAFDEVERRVARHPMALAARVPAGETSDADLDERLQPLRMRGAHADAAVAVAVRRTVRHLEPDVAGIRAALHQTPGGPAAWSFPLDPMLRPMRDVPRWAPVLALLRSRAA
jgi:DNA-binding winged helix-turn-helix (wHTH) protein